LNKRVERFLGYDGGSAKLSHVQHAAQADFSKLRCLAAQAYHSLGGPKKAMSLLRVTYRRYALHVMICLDENG
jgi:hypothetical protein